MPPPPLRKLSTPGTIPGHEVTEDTPADMLEGRMDLTVLLPNDKTIRMTVERSTPMMDLLIQVTTANKINPGGHMIHVVSDRGSNFLTYKPSTPIGTLDTSTVQVVPKNKINEIANKKVKKAPPRPNEHSFEKTVRLQVNLPRSQLAVMRVSTRAPLCDILKQVCQEKNLDPSKYEMRHPVNLDERLRPSCCLADYSLQEVTVVPINSRTGSVLSSADVIIMQKKDEERKKSGIFSFFSKKSKSSLGDSSTSSDSFGDRSVSPARSDDFPQRPQTLSPVPSGPKDPPVRVQTAQAPPRTKKRQAPRPPVPNGKVSPVVGKSSSTVAAEPAGPCSVISAGSCQSSVVHSSVTEGAGRPVVSHSRHSSDSSGYHEATLSDTPESPVDNLSPKSKPMPPLVTRKAVSTSNLTTINSTSNMSLSSAIRKRRAPLPPAPRIIESELAVVPPPRHKNVEKLAEDPGQTEVVVEVHRTEVKDKAPCSDPYPPAPSSNSKVHEVQERTTSFSSESTLEGSHNSDKRPVEKVPDIALTENASSSVAASVDVPHDDESSEDVGAERNNTVVCHNLEKADSHDKNTTNEAIIDSSNGRMEKEWSSEEAAEQSEGNVSDVTPIEEDSGILEDRDTEVNDESNVMSSEGFHVTPANNDHETHLNCEETSRSSPSSRDFEKTKSQIDADIDEAFSAIDTDCATSVEALGEIDNVKTSGENQITWEYRLPDPPTPFKDTSLEVRTAETGLSMFTEVPGEFQDPRRNSLESTSSCGSSSTTSEPPSLPLTSPPPLVSPPSPLLPDVLPVENTVTESSSDDVLEENKENYGLTYGNRMNFSIGSYSSRKENQLGKSESFSHKSRPRPDFAVSRSESLSVQQRPVRLERRLSFEGRPVETEDVNGRPLISGVSHKSSSEIKRENWSQSRQKAMEEPQKPPRKYQMFHRSDELTRPRAQSMQNLVGGRVELNSDLRTHSQQDISAVADESGEPNLQQKYSRLQEQFLYWQQQLLHNQTVLQTKVAPLASKPPPLQSLEVIREVLNQPPNDSLESQGMYNSFDDYTTRSQSLPRPSPSRSASADATTGDKTATLDRKPSTKRYVYQGPPKINLGSWEERQAAPVVALKEDKDYILGQGQSFRSVSSNDLRTTVSNPVVTSDRTEVSEKLTEIFKRPEGRLRDGSGSTSSGKRRKPAPTPGAVDVIRSDSLRQIRKELMTNSRLPAASTNGESAFVGDKVDSSKPVKDKYYFGKVNHDNSVSTKSSVSALAKVNNNTALGEPLTLTYFGGESKARGLEKIDKPEDKKVTVVSVRPETIKSQPRPVLMTVNPKENKRANGTVVNISSAKVNPLTVPATKHKVDPIVVGFRTSDSTKMVTGSSTVPAPPPPPAPVLPVSHQKSKKAAKIVKPQPKLDAREELMIAIRNFGGGSSLRKVERS